MCRWLQCGRWIAHSGQPQQYVIFTELPELRDTAALCPSHPRAEGIFNLIRSDANFQPQSLLEQVGTVQIRGAGTRLRAAPQGRHEDKCLSQNPRMDRLRN